MSSKIRNVALLLPALVLATGIASAQPSIRVNSTNADGTTSTTTLKSDNGGPAAQAPATGRFWDSLSSTDYYNRPPYIAAPPNPQIAVGPDDIFVVVNRTIAHYPNPNAGGAGQGITVPNPYLNPPTEQAWLDVWLGLSNLSATGGGTNNNGVTNSPALCPSGTGNNATCVIDNASIRYDQMQGRFVVLFTVTDLPAHRSNIIVIVSKTSQFTKCASTTPAPATCPASSPLFTPPVIAPIVGGTQTGGQNAANWFLYKVPLNLTYRNDNAGVTTEQGLGLGRVSTPIVITTGGATTVNFLQTPFCANGGPPVGPLGTVSGGQSVVARACTNYFPTAARMGFDNDNMIIAAPVLDMAYGGTAAGPPASATEGTLASAGQVQGVYAGTRVVTLPKLVLYNANNLGTDQPPGCLGANPISCQAINLADNTATGTVTVAATGVVSNPINPTLGGCAVLNPPATCATTLASLVSIGATIPAIFFEPDNLRGRALASFDAQVATPFSLTSGIVTPFDYLVGTRITGNFGAGIVFDGTSGIQYFLQPIVFSCPGSAVAIFPGPSGVSFCGATSASQVPDFPVLGPMRANAFSQLAVSDPATVGQGFSAQQLTTNPANNPVTGTANSRLFVGDSRPQQAMFREGLLYVARTVRTFDVLPANALNSSTVLYELLKTCAAGPGPVTTNGNTAPNCSASFSPTGGNISQAVSAMSGIWTYATNVPDPSGNPAGFGFYQPMFESPADVVNSFSGGPTPPINTFPWLENVFVGMTTGGTANLASTFSKNYPSLWDFRPGDDAYDTALPYLNPYTGAVLNSVPCPGNVTVIASVTKGSSTFTVADATGLQVGMYLTSSSVSSFPAQITGITSNGTGGATVTLSSAFSGNTSTNQSLTFSLQPPGVSFTINQLVDGSPFITVSSAVGLQIGMTLSSQASVSKSGSIITAALPNQITVSGLNNTGVAAGETITGGSNNATANTVAGSAIISVPANAAVAPLENVTGTGVIPAGTTIVATAPTANCPAATFPGPSPIVANPADAGATLLVCLSAAATATGSNSLAFDASTFFSNPPGPNGAANTAGNLATPPATAFAVAFAPNANPSGFGVITANQTINSNTGTVPPPSGNGITTTYTANYNSASPFSFFAASTPLTIVNITGNTIQLDRPATLSGGAKFPGVAFPSCTVPVPAGGNTTALCTGPLPATAAVGAAATNCPMIPFSSRGGASTDPNDGSLWLYGEFAKNRLSTIPGPGQWGTAVANYPLNFPAVDTYYNDNTFFQDVQPGNVFFTWVQIAKNVGLAQPALTGPCTNLNGTTPIPQPPAPGTTPTPGTTQLICPYFGPDTVVNRAEMAYWVVRSQMDETMVSNYLCATGGDPTGISTCTGVSGGGTANTFADTSSVNNPFISVPTLGFPGVTSNQLIRYIEVMARRGYTKGCGSTNDPLSRYCPNDPVKRQEMAVFLIRAKMNNVFPTQLSGIPLTGIYGDNFGNFLPTPYFSDVTQNAGDPSADYFKYIQKMRELRITNGTSGSTFSPAQSLTRKEIATFVIRAFFL